SPSGAGAMISASQFSQFRPKPCSPASRNSGMAESPSKRSATKRAPLSASRSRASRRASSHSSREKSSRPTRTSATRSIRSSPLSPWASSAISRIRGSSACSSSPASGESSPSSGEPAGSASSIPPISRSVSMAAQILSALIASSGMVAPPSRMSLASTSEPDETFSGECPMRRCNHRTISSSRASARRLRVFLQLARRRLDALAPPSLNGLAPEDVETGSHDHGRADEQMTGRNITPHDEAEDRRPDQGEIIERRYRRGRREMQRLRPPILRDAVGEAGRRHEERVLESGCGEAKRQQQRGEAGDQRELIEGQR